MSPLTDHPAPTADELIDRARTLLNAARVDEAEPFVAVLAARDLLADALLVIPPPPLRRLV